MGETTAIPYVIRLLWWRIRWEIWSFWIGPYFVFKGCNGVFWQKNPYCDDQGKLHEICWSRRDA